MRGIEARAALSRYNRGAQALVTLLARWRLKRWLGDCRRAVQISRYEQGLGLDSGMCEAKQRREVLPDWFDEDDMAKASGN